MPNLFSNFKFFCFSPTKDLSDKKIKDDILKKIEVNGGVVQYCIQKYSTNFIIICNGKDEYDRDQHYYSFQPSSLQFLEKSNNLNLPLLSYRFIKDCIDKNQIIDNLENYKISNIIDEQIIKIEYSKDKIKLKEEEEEKEEEKDDDDEEEEKEEEKYEDSNDFFDIFFDTFKPNDNLPENLSNQPQKEEKIKEKFKFKSTYISDRKLAMNQKKSSSSSTTTTTTTTFIDINKNEDYDKNIINKEDDYDKNIINKEDDLNEMDFNLFSSIDFEINKSNEEEYNLFNIGHYEENDIQKNISNFENLNIKNNNNGFIFQFINKNISLYHEKDFPNNFKSIKLFKQSMSGLSCMITEDNKCYIWGNIKSNQKVEQKDQYYQVDYCSVGNSHSVMIKRGIYTVGTNKFGQLGYRNENNNYNQINKNEILQKSILILKQNFLKKVLMVSCGKNFNILLTNEGQVFSWGKNDQGQLGLGFKNLKENYEIQLVNFNEKNKFISFVSCGDSHSIAIEPDSIENNYKLYGWGNNSQGQIGEKYSLSPILIKNINNSSGNSNSNNNEFYWKLPKVLCLYDTTIIIEKPLNFTTFGIKYNSFLLELKENFQDLNQFDLVILKKRKIGVLIFDEYLKSSFLLKSINYNENYHYQVIKKIIESDKFKLIDAIKLSKDCCEFGNLNVFKLLELKFPLNLIDSISLENPIHFITLFNHLNSKSILEYCLDNNIYSIDQLNKSKETPLHYCSKIGNYEIAKLLLQRGCNRNLKDSQGQTPLHISVSKNDHQMSSLLCKHGAQSIPDKTMKTPLQYCSGDIKSNLQNILFTNEVFISYAHKDSEFVNNLRSTFGLFSLRCWLDEYRLQAGCNWRAEITKGVVNSNVIIFVVSETSINSLWCRKELKMSKKLGKTIIPIFLHSIKIDPILFGLFSFFPKVSKQTFKEMSQNEIISNISSISNIIHLILNATKESKLLIIQQQQQKQQQSHERSIQLLSRKEFFDKYYSNDKNIGCYLIFNRSDRILFDYICDRFKFHSIPTISSDEIIGRPSDQDDEFSLLNQLKQKKQNSIQRKKDKELENKLKFENDEKLKQQWKIKRKIEKKLEKSKLDPLDSNYQYLKNYLIQLYNFNNLENNLENNLGNNLENNPNNQNNQNFDQFNNYNFNDNYEIPVLNNDFNLNDLNNNNNNNLIITTLNEEINNQNIIYYDDGKISEEDFYKQISIEKENEKYYSIQPLREFINNSLLLVILFTIKTTNIDIENFCLQIEYARSLKDENGNQDKTIIVLTPDLSLKDDLKTPSIIKDLVWYKIDSKNIDLVFENIVSIYEVLEKTLQISNLVGSS